MKKRANEASVTNFWSLAEAARELDLPRREIKGWRARFDWLEIPNDELNVRDMRVLHALKALLIDHHYTAGEVERLFAQLGEAAVVAAYGGAPNARLAQANPARALQDAVRSAAAAGFFGEVYAAVEDEAGEAPSLPVASYAQARLARLK